MRIKTNKGTEVELLPEELRHFKIHKAVDLKEFIDAIETKSQIGFHSKKHKNRSS